MRGTCCLNVMHCVVLVIDMQLSRTQSIFAHAEFAWGLAREDCINYLLIKLRCWCVPVQETDARIAYGSSHLKILESPSDGSDKVCPCFSLCLGFCDLVMPTGSTKYSTAELGFPAVKLL